MSSYQNCYYYELINLKKLLIYLKLLGNSFYCLIYKIYKTIFVFNFLLVYPHVTNFNIFKWKLSVNWETEKDSASDRNEIYEKS